MSEPTSTPDPDSGDRPRYGEYAPPGWTPPQQERPAAAEAEVRAAAPAAAPGYSAPAHPATSPSAPRQPAWPAASDSAYAPGGWGDSPAPTVRPRRGWDIVVTIILLVLGLIGTAIAIIEAAVFSNREVLDQALRQSGRGSFDGDPGPYPGIIIVAHLVLFLLAVILSIVSLLKRRLTFWIPLVIGAVAAIVFWVCLFLIIASDPQLTSRMTGG